MIGGKRQALGRGLAALIPGAALPETEAGRGGRPTPGPPAPSFASPKEGLRQVAIEDIHPAPGQPRKRFDDARLQELAASIRTLGIIAPLVVRARSAGGYELIAGERRWRAAQKAALHELPVVVRDVAEPRAFEMALVENLQREDLNPIEEAQGFERLIADFDYTQEALALRVGKDRSTVANALRLLKLPASVRELVIDGRLSMGHARALLGLAQPVAMERLAKLTVARDLSVRQVEALVRREQQDDPADKAGKTAAPVPSTSARDLTQRLQRALQAKVKIVEAAGGRGHIEIHYASLDELDALLDKILPG